MLLSRDAAGRKSVLITWYPVMFDFSVPWNPFFLGVPQSTTQHCLFLSLVLSKCVILVETSDGIVPAAGGDQVVFLPLAHP